MSRARNAGIYKLPHPNRQTYAKRSKHHDEIEEYIKRHGVKQAVNTNKAYSFNNLAIAKSEG